MSKRTFSVAIATIAGVIFWHLLIVGMAFLWPSKRALPIIILVGLPLIPGGAACAMVGAVHDEVCTPAIIIGNIAFYLVVVFTIRKRRTRKLTTGEQGQQ